MTQSNGVAAWCTVGLDVGDEVTHLVLLDAQGQVLRRGQLATTPAAMEQEFAQRGALRIVLEAGAQSPWLSRQLRGYGHEVLVANARQVRLIHQGPRKSDRRDPEVLARLGRLDPALLAPIAPRSEAAQQTRALLHSREVVVRGRTQLINHVRGTLKSFGVMLPRGSAPTLARRAAPLLPPGLRPLLEPLLALLTQLTATIAQYDTLVEQAATAAGAVTTRLRQVAGVGALTALAYQATVEDPHRFRRSRQVGAYLGLCAKQDQSGQRDPALRITKAGDELLRRLLVTSAHYILGPFGPDTALRRWGLQLAQGGKRAKRRALVAVARKLAVLLHRLWLTGAPYEPLRGAAAA